LSSATAFSGSWISILGQAEVRDPRKTGSEAQFSRKVTGSGSEANASTAPVEDKTAERKLRVTSSAWLERRRSFESGDFVHESRAGMKAPKEDGSRKKSLAGGAEAALERRKRRRLRSWARSPKEDGRAPTV
jgi:hypothetical protein